MLNLDAAYLKEYALKLSNARSKILTAKKKLPNVATGVNWNCPELAQLQPYLDALMTVLNKLENRCDNLSEVLTTGANSFESCNNNAKQYTESLQQQFNKKWGFEADVYNGGKRTITTTPIPPR